MFTGTRYLEVIDTAMVYYAKLSNQQVQQLKNSPTWKTVNMILIIEQSKHF